MGSAQFVGPLCGRALPIATVGITRSSKMRGFEGRRLAGDRHEAQCACDDRAVPGGLVFASSLLFSSPPRQEARLHVASGGEGRVPRSPQDGCRNWPQDHDPFRAPRNGGRAGRNEETQHRTFSSPYRQGSAYALGQSRSQTSGKRFALRRRTDGSRTSRCLRVHTRCNCFLG